MREQGCFHETHTNRDRPDENHYRDVRPVPRRLGVRARAQDRFAQLELPLQQRSV